MQIIQVVYSHCLPFRSSTDRLPSDNLTCWAVIAASKPDALKLAKKITWPQKTTTKDPST